MTTAAQKLGSWARNLRRRPVETIIFHSAGELETWMSDWIGRKLDVAPSEILRDMPFIEAGLDSLAAVEFSGRLEEATGKIISPAAAWEYPTIAELANHIFHYDASAEIADMDL